MDISVTSLGKDKSVLRLIVPDVPDAAPAEDDDAAAGLEVPLAAAAMLAAAAAAEEGMKPGWRLNVAPGGSSGRRDPGGNSIRDPGGSAAATAASNSETSSPNLFQLFTMSVIFGLT